MASKTVNGEAIPPPWHGLNDMSEKMRELFHDPEMAEINGILKSPAAYETTFDMVPEGTKILHTLTNRDIKKNGPKKGQAKVRVCRASTGST